MFRRRSRTGQDAVGRGPAGANDQAAQDEQDFAENGEFDDEDLVYDEDDSFEEARDEDEFEDADEPEAARPAAPAGSRRTPRADLGDPMTWTRLRDSSADNPPADRPAGPWDSEGGYPDAERIDFGSLLVPVREGYDVQVFMSEEEGISIAVVHGESGIQLQPFAAPRSSMSRFLSAAWISRIVSRRAVSPDFMAPVSAALIVSRIMLWNVAFGKPSV